MDVGWRVALVAICLGIGGFPLFMLYSAGYHAHADGSGLTGYATWVWIWLGTMGVLVLVALGAWLQAWAAGQREK
jgi:hypothetical protein